MENKDVFEELEYIKDSLYVIIRDLEHKGNKLVLNKALELIDTVSWQYEEDI